MASYRIIPVHTFVFFPLEQFSLGIVAVAVVAHVRAAQVLAGTHTTIGRQPHQLA
jgi:hypothetical protein